MRRRPDGIPTLPSDRASVSTVTRLEVDLTEAEHLALREAGRRVHLANDLDVVFLAVRRLIEDTGVQVSAEMFPCAGPSSAGRRRG